MSNIKKINEYFKMLSEAFDNPVEIRWVNKDNNLIGLFIVNDNVYQINCNNIGDNFWTYKFFFYDKLKNVMDPNLTGFDKDKYRVLPTIKNGLIYLIENKNIDCLIYGALDDSLSRKKLYNDISNEISTKYNFEYITQGIGEMGKKQIYILYKSSVDRDLLFKKVEKIVNDIENEINF